MSETIEIELSKSKLFLMALGSITFVGLGIWFMRNPEKFVSSIFNSTTKIFASGLVSVLFFGFVGFYIIKKIFDKNPGLVISDDGIVDNSSGISVGFIPWSDILEIKEAKIVNHKFINLVVKDPQSYIDRQPSAFKRWTMKKNYTTFDTAIGISANSLEYNFEDLKNLLYSKFKEYNLISKVGQH